MDQKERRIYLTNYLLKEEGYKDEIPKDEFSQRRLLRSLLNVREPKPISDEFLKIQDEYLREEALLKGITDAESLDYVDDLTVWQGDISTLKIDGIVNAANSQMLGCFCPCHSCIDNVIHTFAGVQLRWECFKIMQAQGREEPTGKAKITKAYNLPCKYVLHTVGPIVDGRLNEKHKQDLASCYESCLDLADKNGLKSLAFCCISTGVFSFPNDEASKIAVKTVKDYKAKTNSKIKIVFNVFKDIDYELYTRLLSRN